MAKDNNLQDFLTDIADAIREKKGTTEKINPQDFATEIANLSSGGGSGSGSSLKYLPKYYSIDWSVADEGWKSVLKGGEEFPPAEIAATIKSGYFITPIDAIEPEVSVNAFSFLPVGWQNNSTFDVTIFETLESVIDFFKKDFSIPVSMNGIKEISEEEFYSFDNNNVPQ